MWRIAGQTPSGAIGLKCFVDTHEWPGGLKKSKTLGPSASTEIDL